MKKKYNHQYIGDHLHIRNYHLFPLEGAYYHIYEFPPCGTMIDRINFQIGFLQLYACNDRAANLNK